MGIFDLLSRLRKVTTTTGREMPDAADGTEAVRLLMAERFEEAIPAFQAGLAQDPDNAAFLDGLARAYVGACRYAEAVPLLWCNHEISIAEIPDSPGQRLNLACAYWCLDDRPKAVEMTRVLCSDLLARKVNMAPDLAGGATFGLILHYMAVTVADEASLQFALSSLSRLNTQYDKRPLRYSYPVQTVKHVLGELDFDAAVKAATDMPTLGEALKAAKGSRSVARQLGYALFQDGAIRRQAGDEAGCRLRMQQVHMLGPAVQYQWHLARHELAGLLPDKQSAPLKRLF